MLGIPLCFSRNCQPCMLDPLCGFCYRDNGTTIYDSSCVPVNETYTNLAAWGRSGSPGLFVTSASKSKRVMWLTGSLFVCIQMLQPDGGCRRSVLGLQLLSYVLLLARPAGPPPLSGLLCSRYRNQSLIKPDRLSLIRPWICRRFRHGHHAVDRELGDLPAVGPQHR